MKLNIEQKSYIQKDGTIWVWNESAELRKFIKEQEQKITQNNKHT